MKKKIIIGVSAIVFLAILATLLYIFLEYLPEKRQSEERAEAMQNYYNAKVEQYAEENKEYDPFEVDVAFIGDSLTDGYDVKTYYPDLVVLNRGIGGDTTFGVERRLKVSLYDVQPKVVVMLIGANNLGEMFENYESILKGFKENLPNSKIILLSLTSMGRDWGKNNHLAAFNNVKIKALSEKYGYEYVDLYTALLNMQTNEIYEHYTTDGGHLTPEGYEVLTSEIRPVIDGLLAGYIS